MSNESQPLYGLWQHLPLNTPTPERNMAAAVAYLLKRYSTSKQAWQTVARLYDASDYESLNNAGALA